MSDRSAMRWLAAGALLGIAIASATLVRRGETPAAAAVPRAAGDTVALVNGEPVTRDKLARFTAALAQQRGGRTELGAAERRQILDRLIDEELLLQRGLALGLERSDPAARGAIVSAVMDAITSDATRVPDRAELEAFHRETASEWTRPGRITVEAVLVPAGLPDADTRAAEIARRARAGESLAALAAALARPLDPPLPPGPLTREALRDRAGDRVVAAVAALSPGEVTEPVRAMDGLWIVRLAAREPDQVPSIEQVWEPLVEAWRKREHERRLADELAALRRAARIEITDPSLAGG